MYPILFTIPWIHLPIYSYGVMLGLSFIVGWVLIMHLGSIDGVAKERLAGCFIVTAVFAIVGARMLYILTNLEEFQRGGLLRVVDLRKGGLVAYGGFLGGFLGSWIYMSYYRITLWVFADVVAFALASGLGITRIGCFLFGCDWGKPIPVSAPEFIKAIGVRFPNWDIQFNGFREISHGLGSALANLHGSPAFLHHVSQGWVSPNVAFSAYVYPTQLLESLNGWIAFILLLIARKRSRFRGQVFCLFTMYYGLTRTAMELLRGDTGRGEAGGFSTSQWIGLATFALSLIVYWVLSRRAAMGSSVRPGADS
ncbi:MAG: prolipoprotein diacylglyceryl transferase [Syntrophales bacterium]|nr:prolipoprotein diacylglyceryl transferase [Syntrophales bacterium]